MRQKLPKKTHYQRIENRTGQGMPDVYMCMDGVPIWAELKIIKNDRVSVSISQIAWHTAHKRCGGVSFFLLTPPSRGDAILFDGALAAQFQDSRITALRPAALYIGELAGVPCALRALSMDMWSCGPASCGPADMIEAQKENPGT